MVIGFLGGLLDGLDAILFEVLNAVLDGLAAAVNILLVAWPVPMPSLPSMPSQVGTAIQWLRWSPFPIDALASFFVFTIAVLGAWYVARPALRWLKVDD